MAEPTYVVNVDVAVYRDEEYLFIERAETEPHAAGMLGFPGGKLEAAAATSDVIEATAAREVQEEVGVTVEDTAYVQSSTFETDHGYQCLNVLTAARYVEGRARPRAADEIAAVCWCTPEEIDERSDVPSFTREYLDLVEQFREHG